MVHSPDRAVPSAEATAPALAVVVLVGPHHERTAAVLSALARQECPAGCEAVLVAFRTAPGEGAPASAGLPVTWIAAGEGASWGAARAAGVRASRAPVVAFVEDHCPPEPGWAGAVLAAFATGAAAVGYTFTNGSPDRLLYRTILFSEYGPWLHPSPGGAARDLPSNNVAYRRDLLLGLGERLPELLEVDFNLHRLLAGRGERLWLAADAVAAHQSTARLGDLFRGHFSFARVLAVQRSESEGWSRSRRLAHGLAAPLAVPLLRLARLWRTVRLQPGGRRRLLASLPLLQPLYLWSALGESAGCLLGRGRAPVSLATMELEWPRAARSTSA